MDQASKPVKTPITARELAKLLGISQSTVSRAFTKGASVSPKTREYVLKSAERLGYQPNAIASILSKRTGAIVGVVVSDMQNPFYPALLERLSQRLQATGLHPLLFVAPPGSDISEQLLLLRQYSVDSVIVLSATVSSGAAIRWAADGRTVILMNRVVPDAPVSSICCDNALGAAAVADHFYAAGHRRIAYVAGRPDTSTNIERETAFTRRVAELGMTLSARRSGGEYSYEAGYRAVLDIGDAGVEAILFANDILAIGGLDALRDRLGLRLPTDISVVGFDDIAMAAWPRYQLTTVRQPVDRMLDIAIDLLETPAGQRAEHTYRLPGELVLRATTRPLPAAATAAEPTGGTR